MADILKPLTTIHDKLNKLEDAAEDAGNAARDKVRDLYLEAEAHFAKADAASIARSTLASALGIGGTLPTGNPAPASIAPAQAITTPTA